MPWDIARRAIDYLEAHSSSLKKVAITFYGGEPLLNVDTITRTVEYALGRMQGRHLDFGISTNGTLLTADVARFLSSNDFRVALSLDGPKTGDKHRVDPRQWVLRSGPMWTGLLLAEYARSGTTNLMNMVTCRHSVWRSLIRSVAGKKVTPSSHLRVHITYPIAGSQP